MPDKELPTNWRAARDSDGKEYYFNELTGETSWVFPEPAAEKPADPQPMAAAEPEPITADANDGEAAASDVQITVKPMSRGAKARAARFGAGGDYAGNVAGILGDNLPKYVVILVSAFVLMVQSAVELGRVGALSLGNIGKSPEYAYGVAVGVVSLFFTLVFLFLCKKKPDTILSWTLPKVPGELQIAQLLALFHFLWWGVGCIILTFGAPYLDTTNAYFALWGGFIASSLILANSFQRVSSAFQSMTSVQEDVSLSPLAGLAISSGIVFFCTIEYVNVHKMGLYGFIVSLITSIIGSLLFLLISRQKLGDGPKKGVSAVLLLLWAITAIILTFDGPFTKTGNGYFGSWAALICCAAFAYESYIKEPLGIVNRVRASFSFAAFEGSERDAGGGASSGTPRA